MPTWCQEGWKHKCVLSGGMFGWAWHFVCPSVCIKNLQCTQVKGNGDILKKSLSLVCETKNKYLLLGNKKKYKVLQNRESCENVNFKGKWLTIFLRLVVQVGEVWVVKEHGLRGLDGVQSMCWLTVYIVYIYARNIQRCLCLWAYMWLWASRGCMGFRQPVKHTSQLTKQSLMHLHLEFNVRTSLSVGPNMYLDR